jgi:hypothetical protein
MQSFHDHATLITALGGAAKVAAAQTVDTLPVNVRAWAARNRIPAEHWEGVIAFAETAGATVTADWLMRTTPARAARSLPQAQEAAA